MEDVTEIVLARVVLDLSRVFDDCIVQLSLGATSSETVGQVPLTLSCEPQVLSLGLKESQPATKIALFCAAEEKF